MSSLNWNELDKTTRKNFSLDLLSSVLRGIFFAVSTSFFTVVAIRLGASSFLVSVLIAAPFASRLLTPLWASQTNTSNKIKFVAIPWILGRGLLVFVALTKSPQVYVFIILCYYISEAITIPAYASIVRDMYDQKVRGRLMSFVQIGEILVTVISSLVIGRGLDQLGYRNLFPVTAILGASAGLIIWKIHLPKAGGVATKKLIKLKDIFALVWINRRYGIYSLAVMIFGIGHLIAAGSYPMYQIKVLNLSNFYIGILSSVFSLLGIVGTYASGRIIDKLNPLYAATLMIGVWFFLPTLYLLKGSFLTLLVASVFHGLANGGLSLAYPNVAIYFANDEDPSGYMAIHSTLGGVRGLVAPILGAWIFEKYGYQAVFSVSAVLIFLGTMILFSLVRKL
ncbi:hypothetical protein SY88_20315 [Clostridiales bacterium PH28_bin88]|nr:hypothetical protein SY88_20315 [Clostridiales bacterium PH28_bin88]